MFQAFPLQENTKLPAVKWKDKTHWKDWSTIDPDLIPNIGIPTGKDNGIVVLDVDVKSGGLQSLDLLNLPTTYTVRTAGGGFHFYFRYPAEELRNSASKLMPGIDVRGEGGYVVGQGSVIDGNPYSLDKDTDLADLPSPIIEMLKTKPKDTLKASGVAASDAEVMEGSRNDYISRVAGALRRKNMAFGTVLTACMAENEEKCSPPMDETEVEQIVTSIFRYTPEDPIVSKPIYVTASDLFEPMVNFLSDKDQVKGEPTGIQGIDELLGGGKRLGEVTAWHAEAKTGKNTLWHKLMHTWLNNSIPIAYASRELMADREVLPNILSLEFERNMWLEEDIDSVIIKQRLDSWPLYFAPGYGYFPWEEIKTWVSSLYAVGVRHFWFDHLHYMLEDPEDHKAASKLIKELKALAVSMGIHIDIIIQPNKLMFGQKLGLGSIKGGSAMGQAIDNLFTLQRCKDSPHTVEIILDVARSKLAKLGNLYLRYDRDTTDFTEMTPHVDSPAD